MQILEFQEMMRRIYFHRDTERGTAGTYKWLLDEVKELGDALNGDDPKALEDEFADVLAWLASLANVTNIDLECAATTKYANRCPKCQETLCKCSSSK